MINLMKPTGSMDPFALMDDFRRSFWSDPFFNETFAPRFPSAAGPRVTVAERDGRLQVRLDVPGLSAQDLKVEAEGEYLTLSGGRQVETPEGYRELRRERSDYRFSRRFRIGREYDASAAEAKFEAGTLTIEVPRRPELAPRQIPIESA